MPDNYDLIKDEEVKVYSCSLNDLLTANIQKKDIGIPTGQLVIPEYQRPYVWNTKQINALLNDWLEYKSSFEENKSETPKYYLGSIILHKDGDQLKIIDGQQRITTALLIKKLQDPIFQSGVQYHSGISENNIKRNFAYLNSIKHGDIFEFKKDPELIKGFNFSEINVTLIITQTEDLAYTFFETQNTGGVRLSGTDILKAHHLRALEKPKLINYQAKRWESINNSRVGHVVDLLTKIRFWDNRKWRMFPFYRDKQGIKNSIIHEYTTNTNKSKEDVSFYHCVVKMVNGDSLQMLESPFKQVRQPLFDGNNTLDYINEYITLYQQLFESDDHHLVDDRFYNFRKMVLHGNYGTVFLKELFEIVLLAYVGRFGYQQIYEASLWLYRAIYSNRVSTGRNIREDGVFKFVKERQFIDNILEAFTTSELFQYLEKFSYKFNTDYLTKGKSKRVHVNTLKSYFENEFQTIDVYEKNPDEFDKDLIKAINNKLKK